MTESSEALQLSQIGEIRRTFKPNLLNQMAGYLVGVLFFGGGCFFLVAGLRKLKDFRAQYAIGGDYGDHLGAIILGTLVGVGFIAGSLFLIRWLRSLATLRVYLGKDGFCVIRNQQTEIFIWDQIHSVEETIHYESPPLPSRSVSQLLPKTKSRSYIMKRKDGREFAFNVNYLEDHDLFAELVKRETRRREISWLVQEQYD